MNKELLFCRFYRPTRYTADVPPRNIVHYAGVWSLAL